MHPAKATVAGGDLLPGAVAGLAGVVVAGPVAEAGEVLVVLAEAASEAAAPAENGKTPVLFS